MKKTHPKIKVCGMRDPANIKQLLKLRPNYIGFILYPKSKRYLGDEYELAVKIPARTKRVGVFVNALISDVVGWVNRLQLDYVQIHGDEQPEYCIELQRMNIPVIKAFGIDENFNFNLLKDYEDSCSYFLFDTKTPLRGGSGKQFNWELLTQYKGSKPFFLSGGIGPHDASELNKLNHLPIHAFDINSKFEVEPAKKDINLLQQFITEVRTK